MTPEAAVEALRAIHVHTVWTYTDSDGWITRRDGCRSCGARLPAEAQSWPCETRRILDIVEAGR